MNFNKKYYFLYLVFLCFPNLSFSFPLKQENFLVITDIHLSSTSKHAMDINPNKYKPENDLDLANFKKLLKILSENVKKRNISQPKFILCLGDLVGHLRTTTKAVIQDEVIVFSELKNNFPKTPIFYVFGNNDSLAINYGPFSVNNLPKKDTSPYEIAQSRASWKNGFLSNGNICQSDTKETNFPCLLQIEKKQGYYSAYLAPKLRLITLNSILFSVLRKQVTAQDASKQLLWLKSQLERAKASQESVLLAMHIPPGQNVYDNSSFWLPKEEAVFLKMISRYHNRIIGILVAHTHAEELKIIKDASNKNIASVYFTAALSTAHGNAPSVKTFYFDKNSSEAWQLRNFETFHFYINNQNQLLFSKLYDYNAYYCNRNPAGRIFQYLNNVTPEKMNTYFSAGNPNFSGNIKFPDAIVITLQPEKEDFN